ncbi:MAG: hypothetical protein JMDDDDMK_03662 [Acidobacteria bacterium]|nr:hypothetical protein [Acidobacteriota bacterium]
MITADQLLAHVVGDYILQSDWMATEKTKRSVAAAAHAVSYAVPFVIAFRPSWAALAVITGTHFVIDRWRLARFVIYAKNFMAPRSKWASWSDCAGTGYHKDVPPWLSVWLLIIVDNTMHVFINGLALEFL